MSQNRGARWLFGAALLMLAAAAPALADSRIERNLKLDLGGRFVLDTDAGSVTVTGSGESGARVLITSNRDDLESLFTFSFEDGPREARVTARKIHRFESIRHLSLHYEVRVPGSTSLEVKTSGGSVGIHSIKGDCDLKTSGGSIEASNVAGSLSADTSGGGIHLREVTGDTRLRTSGGSLQIESLSGALRGSTSGGPVRIERVEGDVFVGTSGGSIEIDGAGGRVEAKTSGGSVHVSFDRGNGRGGVLETSGGSIRVALDPAVNLTLDASVSGGSVRSDLPLTVTGTVSSSRLHGSLGSGGETLRLHTSGGSIHIESR